jgi:hypothetical protein
VHPKCHGPHAQYVNYNLGNADLMESYRDETFTQ